MPKGLVSFLTQECLFLGSNQVTGCLTC